MDKVSAARNRTIQNLVDSVSEVVMVVATRFHSILVPMLQGKPVVGLGYHQKVKELLEEAGLGEYCVDVFDFNLEELYTKFDLLIENREEVKRIIERYQKNNEKYWMSNGIESFWSFAKRRLTQLNGVPKHTFYLHLKETEFRFNHRSINLYNILLDKLREDPLWELNFIRPKLLLLNGSKCLDKKLGFTQ